MEVPGGHKNKTFVLLSELIGTCFLMIVINWSSVTDTTPQCAGFAVMMLVQIFGSTSGGHFNPAVTLGMLLKEGSAHWLRNTAMAFAMIIFQGAGAALGCVICALAFVWEPSKDKTIPDTGYHVAQLCPSEGCNGSAFILRKVFFVEFLCTFVFVSNVMMIVKHNGSAQVPVNAIAIGLSLYLAIRVSSGISGGCINPAVGLFQTMFQSIANGAKYPNAEETSWMSLGVYVGGPFLGGWFAGFWHKLVHEDAVAQAREFRDPEYEELLAQGVYTPRAGMVGKLRAESRKRAAQAAEKQAEVKRAVFKQAIEPLWPDFDTDNSGFISDQDFLGLGLRAFEELSVPVDADDFEPMVDAAKAALAATDEDAAPREQMDIDYVAKLLVFMATGS